MGDGLLARIGGWALALTFGLAVSAMGVPVIYRLFAPVPLGWQSIARGAVAAAAAISVYRSGT